MWDLHELRFEPFRLSSQPHFEGIYCCQTRLCLWLVWWFFSKHCRSLGWKNEKRNDLELSVLDTAWLFISVENLGVFLCLFNLTSDLFRALLLFPPLSLLFYFGGTFLIVLCRLNGHLVFPGSGGSSPPWFLRDRWSLWMQIEIPSTGTSLSLT